MQPSSANSVVIAETTKMTDISHLNIPNGSHRPFFYDVTLLTDDDLNEIMANPKVGIYHVPARTHTNWFQLGVVRKAHGFMLVRGKPTAMIAFGADFMQELTKYHQFGFLVRFHAETPGNRH